MPREAATNLKQQFKDRGSQDKKQIFNFFDEEKQKPISEKDSEGSISNITNFNVDDTNKQGNILLENMALDVLLNSRKKRSLLYINNYSKKNVVSPMAAAIEIFKNRKKSIEKHNIINFNISDYEKNVESKKLENDKIGVVSPNKKVLIPKSHKFKNEIEIDLTNPNKNFTKACTGISALSNNNNSENQAIFNNNLNIFDQYLHKGIETGVKIEKIEAEIQTDLTSAIFVGNLGSDENTLKLFENDFRDNYDNFSKFTNEFHGLLFIMKEGKEFSYEAYEEQIEGLKQMIFELSENYKRLDIDKIKIFDELDQMMKDSQLIKINWELLTKITNISL